MLDVRLSDVLGAIIDGGYDVNDLDFLDSSYDDLYDEGDVL